MMRMLSPGPRNFLANYLNHVREPDSETGEIVTNCHELVTCCCGFWEIRHAQHEPGFTPTLVLNPQCSWIDSAACATETPTLVWIINTRTRLLKHGCSGGMPTHASEETDQKGCPLELETCPRGCFQRSARSCERSTLPQVLWFKEAASHPVWCLRSWTRSSATAGWIPNLLCQSGTHRYGGAICTDGKGNAGNSVCTGKIPPVYVCTPSDSALWPSPPGSYTGETTLLDSETPARYAYASTNVWSKVGTDLFSIEDIDYLVTVDYTSNFIGVDRLENTDSRAAVRKLKTHLARYGILDQVISDNGPQFTSDSFAHSWDFGHITSSPGYSQSNGMVESAVKTAKKIIRKASKAKSDVYLALLDHRNTPTQGMWASPAQIILSRTKTLLPTSASLLNPKVTYNHGLKLKNKERQTQYYNTGAKDLGPLNERDVIRMRPFKKGEKSWKKDTVTRRLDERSYEVDDGNRTYRRNRVDLARQAHVNEKQPRL